PVPEDPRTDLSLPPLTGKGEAVRLIERLLQLQVLPVLQPHQVDADDVADESPRVPEPAGPFSFQHPGRKRRVELQQNTVHTLLL
ncbi:MAG: hypothetical protein WCP19_15335, partial [Chloroflexota bacterium]